MTEDLTAGHHVGRAMRARKRAGDPGHGVCRAILAELPAQRTGEDVESGGCRPPGLSAMVRWMGGRAGGGFPDLLSGPLDKIDFVALIAGPGHRAGPAGDGPPWRWG